MSPFRAQLSYAAGVRRIAAQLISQPVVTPTRTPPRASVWQPAQHGPTRPAPQRIDVGHRLRDDHLLPDDRSSDQSALTAPTGAASRRRS